MKRRRGFVQMAILHLLDEAPMHGYQIMKELEIRSGGHYSASAGTVYPALQELLEKEMIGLEPSSDKKTYFIEAKGNSRLVEFANRKEGEFWSNWEDRWSWQNSEEAIRLNETIDLWELELRKAIKQTRSIPENSPRLIAFIKEITERLQQENY
ncbi:DNA-binding transcriptional regulator, PadR family [Psychrobacillus sp. OK028]|uniref:PadR family transcriptional regulator n=1 Tax=Psychrobacillus sp. OK028 TaxID=1884359 RepID=UPI000882222C|nr:PadR family transcriptional regulator [Psychrobacillus sp. OK028]SDN40949.1 DNA-binding transcriptional regulator, PadR family [Psychrobacillus sp. OK028]